MRIAEWKLNALVRNENRCKPQTVGRPEAEVFHIARSRIGIDPQFHECVPVSVIVS
jgi:hypothetical protein